MDKQTAKLVARIAENLPEMDGNIMQGWIDNPKALQKVLKHALCPPESMSSKAEIVLDQIIRVDRSVRPVYPDWAKTVVHPELENTGPAEYDISEVEQWLHDGQKDGKWIEGNKIYTHLKDNDALKTCLGLRDLEEIQKKGIIFFWKYFQGKAVFAWKGAVRDRNGRLLAPCLFENGDEVVLSWRWLALVWHVNLLALRFASQ